LVLLKNCLPARYAKLAAVHGAAARSNCASTTPWLVVTVIVEVPVLAIPVVGGLPTSLALPVAGIGVQAQSSATFVVVFLLLSKPPTAHTMPTTTATTASPAASEAWICRRRRAPAARRAIWRSSLARASARCRVLLGATGRSPSELVDDG
jgi:hypothetical protein